MTCPTQHRAKLHSTNPLERLNGGSSAAPRSSASSPTKRRSPGSSAPSCSNRTTNGPSSAPATSCWKASRRSAMIPSSACQPWRPHQPGQRRHSTVPTVSYTTSWDTTPPSIQKPWPSTWNSSSVAWTLGRRKDRPAEEAPQAVDLAARQDRLLASRLRRRNGRNDCTIAPGKTVQTFRQIDWALVLGPQIVGALKSASSGKLASRSDMMRSAAFGHAMPMSGSFHLTPHAWAGL